MQVATVVAQFCMYKDILPDFGRQYSDVDYFVWPVQLVISPLSSSVPCVLVHTVSYVTEVAKGVGQIKEGSQE